MSLWVLYMQFMEISLLFFAMWIGYYWSPFSHLLNLKCHSILGTKLSVVLASLKIRAVSTLINKFVLWFFAKLKFTSSLNVGNINAMEWHFSISATFVYKLSCQRTNDYNSVTSDISGPTLTLNSTWLNRRINYKHKNLQD